MLEFVSIFNENLWHIQICCNPFTSLYPRHFPSSNGLFQQDDTTYPPQSWSGDLETSTNFHIPTRFKSNWVMYETCKRYVWVMYITCKWHVGDSTKFLAVSENMQIHLWITMKRISIDIRTQLFHTPESMLRSIAIVIQAKGWSKHYELAVSNFFYVFQSYSYSTQVGSILFTTDSLALWVLNLQTVFPRCVSSKLQISLSDC